MSDEKGGLPPKQVRLPDEIVKSILRFAEIMHDNITELERWEQFFLGSEFEGDCHKMNEHINEIMTICKSKLRDLEPPALGSAAADGA